MVIQQVNVFKFTYALDLGLQAIKVGSCVIGKTTQPLLFPLLFKNQSLSILYLTILKHLMFYMKHKHLDF